MIEPSEFSDDAYIIDNGDDSYLLFVNGEFCEIDDISSEPFASMPVIKNEE